MSSDESRLLGLDSLITRRDFVGGALIGSGALLLGAPPPSRAQGLSREWNGYAGVGDYARSNGNVASVVNAAHGVRDGTYEAKLNSATPVDELYDLIVVGGGFSGIIAAYEFRKARPNARCLVLDNHPVFGGEAKQNQIPVDAVMLTGPQGSNGTIVPRPDSTYAHVIKLWDEVGLPRSFEFVQPAGAGASLKFARDHYDPMFWGEESTSLGYFFDTPFATQREWVVDPWSDGLHRAPIAQEIRESWLKWKRAPVLSHGDEAATNRWLDSMSYGDLVTREMGLSREVFRLSDPLVATADYGVSSDAISAYGAKLLGLPGTDRNAIASGAFAFPGGNAAILRHIVKALIPEAITGTRSFTDVLYAPIDFNALDRPQQNTRIRLNATAVAVRHDGPPESSRRVDVTYAVDGQLKRAGGKAAIVSAGGWITRHIVRDMPPEYVAAYAQFHHGPILVVNVAVRNWKPFAKLGITTAHWFDGFGFCVNIRQPMAIDGVPVPLDPSKPAMLTLYIGFPQSGAPIQMQTAAGRGLLFATSYADFELKVRRQLQNMFGSAGFDARADIAGIVLNRWGHAYIAPQPGFYFGTQESPAPLEVIRKRYGRIAFGHSELSGRQSWGRAAKEAQRACGQILEVV
jgi:spermidine dehydrogenase